jgi:hypothetical protein
VAIFPAPSPTAEPASRTPLRLGEMLLLRVFTGQRFVP